MGVLPIVTSGVMLTFTGVVLYRGWLRRRPPLLVWGFGLGMFTLAVLAEVALSLDWNPWAFRVWYLCGAMLSAPWIGQGTVFLLMRPSFAQGTAVALATLSGIALVGVLTLPLTGEAFSPTVPIGQQYLRVMPPDAWVRQMTPGLHLYGLLTLVGGALYSAWRFWRQGDAPARMWGNLLVAGGGLAIAFTATLTRLGLGELLHLGELLSAVLMFSGFLVASAPEEASLPHPASRVRA